MKSEHDEKSETETTPAAAESADRVLKLSLMLHSDEQLSPHFQVCEFACHDGTDLVLVDMELVDLLEKIRAHFASPVTIVSAYRTEKHNEAVGGAPKSQHKLGKAADIRVARVLPSAVYRFIDEELGHSGGLGLYRTFVHVDTRSESKRWKQI